MVGLEPPPSWGDEIEKSAKGFCRGAVAWGGLLSGLLIVGRDFDAVVAVSKTASACCRELCRRQHMAGAGWRVRGFVGAVLRFMLSLVPSRASG